MAKYLACLSAEFQEMFNVRDIQAGKEKRDSIISDYRDVSELSMQCLNEGFGRCMTAMEHSGSHSQYYRTSNHMAGRYLPTKY